jgi:hypothetical protein
LQSDGHHDASDELPRAVRELIREHIHSLEQLDLLLFLRARDGQSQTLATATEALGSTDALASATMTHLRRHGLARVTPEFFALYAPRDEQLRQDVTLLAASYRQARAQVLTFLSACALDRVREAQERAFAHAYLGQVLKKK